MRRRAFLAVIAALAAGFPGAQGAQPGGKPSPDGTPGPRVVDASGAVWTPEAASEGCLNRFAFIPIASGCFYLPRWKSEILFVPLA